MEGYLQIYCMILISGIISAFIYRKIARTKENFWATSLLFSTVYYYAVIVLRTIVGNGQNFLGTSFCGKTLRAYVKVGLLEVILFIAILFLLKKTGETGKKLFESTVGIFATLCLLFLVFVEMPYMSATVVLGIMAFALGVLLHALQNCNGICALTEDKISLREKYGLLGAQILFFCALFFLNGPTEIYANNRDEFVFAYKDFIPYMILFTGYLLLVVGTLICNFLQGILFKLTWLLVFIYSILSYIQTLFLNGNMKQLDGVTQNWSIGARVSNLLIWAVLAILLLILALRIKKAEKIYRLAALYIAAIQIFTMIFVTISSDTVRTQNRQVVEDGTLELSQGNNVVVFILDAFDVQMMQKVLEDDSTYLQPLHDFTYYNSMESRYYATDASLPYLLTGVISENGTEDTTFLKDIKENNFDIRILTEAKYVKPLEEKTVDNYSKDYYNLLDFGKTVSQMSECVRYRSAPLAVKKFYHYENYDLTNVIRDTNIYLFGTDAKFYSKLDEQGISISSDMENALRIYHLYGAHSPYYLTENAQLDYHSNPIAQWKGALQIVYRYLECLQEKGLYDETTVIIMADHGLNRSQRIPMQEWNISVTDESNPIFFIKRSNEQHKELIINSSKVSHDDFFPTIIKSIDSDNDNYGDAIWEK